MHRKWDIHSDEARRKCINEIIAVVEDATDAEIGMIAAQDIIDTVTTHLASSIYDQGVKDAKKAIHEKLQDLETDLDLLTRA